MSVVLKTRWSVVFIAVLASIVVALQIGKAPPVIGILRAEFDISLSLAGWVLSTVALTGAIIGPLAGGISDRIGQRRAVVISLVFVIAGCILGAVSTNVSQLLFSRVLESIGFVGVVVSIPSIFMRVVSSHNQRLVFGIWAGYMPFGMAIMMAAAPTLLLLTDWRGIWLSNAVVAAMLLVAFLVITRDLKGTGSSSGQTNIFHAILQVIGRPGPWILAACFMAYAGQWAALMAWLPTYLIEVSGNDISTAAWLTALVVVVNVPGSILGGWLLQRGVTRWYLVAFGSFCMIISGYAIFAEGASDAFRISMAVGFSFIGGLLPPTLLSGAVLHSPTLALTSTTNGVIINGANTGTLLGPPALGTLVAFMGGWQASGTAMAIGGALALFFAILLGLYERRLPVSD